jgi:hypothetical protein
VAGDGLVHRRAILDRIEQCPHLTGVIGGIVCQEAGDDLAGVGADGVSTGSIAARLPPVPAPCTNATPRHTSFR